MAFAQLALSYPSPLWDGDEQRLSAPSMSSLRAPAKQSIVTAARKLDCFVVALLAMTSSDDSRLTAVITSSRSLLATTSRNESRRATCPRPIATNCDQRVILRNSPPQWWDLASLLKSCRGTSFRSWANTVSTWGKARVLSMFRAFLATTPLPSFATPSLATYRIMGQQWACPRYPAIRERRSPWRDGSR